jgi:hypothetical protein
MAKDKKNKSTKNKAKGKGRKPAAPKPVEPPPVFEKGSWQESLQKSSASLARSASAKKAASTLLWKGAQEGITDWIDNHAETDTTAEGLFERVCTALGRSRKGDASKIRQVAVAVRNKGLDLAEFPNLSQAYTKAVSLTRTAQEHAVEDDAAEKAIESIEPPKSTSSVDGAAALLLSKGIDGAVVAILDTLGKDNHDAHRAFARSVATEIVSRVSAAKTAQQEHAKAEAEKARAAKAQEAEKAKAEKEGATESTRTKPASGKDKPAPTTKAKPAKSSTRKAEDKAEEPTEEPAVETSSEEAVTEATAETTSKPAKPKGKPVVRRPSTKSA